MAELLILNTAAMLHFLIPLAIFATTNIAKHFVTEQEEEGIAAGIARGSEEAVQEVQSLLSRQFKHALIRLSINSLLLIAAVLLIPVLFSHAAAVFLIALSYFISLLQGIWQSLHYLRFFKDIYRSHRLNLKIYLEARIYERVYEIAAAEAAQKTDNLWHQFFGSRSAQDIAQTIARHSAVNASTLIWAYLWKKGLLWIIVLITYYLLARFLVIPFLISQETQLSLLDTLIYPIVFTLNYFAHGLYHP